MPAAKCAETGTLECDARTNQGAQETKARKNLQCRKHKGASLKQSLSKPGRDKYDFGDGEQHIPLATNLCLITVSVQTKT